MLVMALIMLLPLLGIALFYLLPWKTALPIYAVAVAFSMFFDWLMMGAMKAPVTTGAKGMIGKTGKVLSWQGHAGKVRTEGEIWKASSGNQDLLEPGDRVEIVEVNEMTLTVRKISKRKQV